MVTASIGSLEHQSTMNQVAVGIPDKPRVLIVEDDEDTGFVYEMLLRMEGYGVSLATTRAEALARALNNFFALIILDVRLPDGDGVELCRRLRALNGATPIIFVSASAYRSDIERGMKAGAQAYITKPADPESLLEKIRNLVGRNAIVFRRSAGG